MAAAPRSDDCTSCRASQSLFPGHRWIATRLPAPTTWKSLTAPCRSVRNCSEGRDRPSAVTQEVSACPLSTTSHSRCRFAARGSRAAARPGACRARYPSVRDDVRHRLHRRQRTAHGDHPGLACAVVHGAGGPVLRVRSARPRAGRRHGGVGPRRRGGPRGTAVAARAGALRPDPGGPGSRWRGRHRRRPRDSQMEGRGGYVVLADLRAGSIRVGVGEPVASGQELGACGNSGNSTQPHLHIQIMDSADAFAARGLPMSFRSYRAWRRPVGRRSWSSTASPTSRRSSNRSDASGHACRRIRGRVLINRGSVIGRPLADRRQRLLQRLSH